MAESSRLRLGIALLVFGLTASVATRADAVKSSVDDAVDSALGAYTLVELAAGCGWLSGAADVSKARSSALAFALSGLPVAQKAQALARLFGDDEKLLVAATSTAQGQVRKGACAVPETRKTWETLSGWLDKLSVQRKPEPAPAPKAAVPPQPVPTAKPKP